MHRTKYTKEAIATLYNDNASVINKRAWVFARLTGRDFDELKSVSHFIFMRATAKFVQGRSSFRTFLGTCLHNGLCDFCKKYPRPQTLWVNRDSEEPDAELEMSTEPDPSHLLIVKDSLLHMSEEAQEVVGIFLNGPAELLELLGDEAPLKVRGLLRRYLRNVLQWPRGVVDKTIREVKDTLKEIAVT